MRMLRYSQKQDHQKVTKRFLHSQLIFEHFYQMYCLPAVNVLLSFLILVLLFFFSYKTFMVRLKCTFQTPLSPNAFSALLLFFFLLETSLTLSPRGLDLTKAVLCFTLILFPTPVIVTSSHQFTLRYLIENCNEQKKLPDAE